MLFRSGLEKQSGRQLVIATVPDLQGYDISDYTYQLGRHWGIGDKEKNDGVVFVVAPNERKVWISTGYGAEGILTDALTARIVRNDIIPRFKAGDMPGGIAAGTDALVKQLSLPPEEARKLAAQAAKDAKSSDDGISPVLIFWIIVLLFIILPMFFGKHKGRRYRRGRGPVVIWGPGSGGWDSGSSWGSGGGSSWGGGGGGGGFSGGGGSFGGGGAGGSW